LIKNQKHVRMGYLSLIAMVLLLVSIVLDGISSAWSELHPNMESELPILWPIFVSRIFSFIQFLTECSGWICLIVYIDRTVGYLNLTTEK